MHLVPLILAFSFVVVVVESDNPQVKLDEYTAVGRSIGNTTNAFFGMPYAKPPVGDLRLEKPVPLPPNDTLVISNDAINAGCLQQTDLSMFGIISSEDCLFWNVFTPTQPAPPGKPYPVIVFIHGGGFAFGSNALYGWQQFASLMNPRGVIVVLIQYRLGFWGFFSLGNKNGLAGNYGLWDQTAAIKFVSKRISKFGGDPTKVTVFGNSAGSASTHALTLSPHSNKYFHRAIQSSGSLYNIYSLSLGTIESSKNISKMLGCYSANAQATKNCLKNVTVPQLWGAMAAWGNVRPSMDLLWWAPILDDDFFVGKSISQLTRVTPVRNVIHGFDRGEGFLFTLKTTYPVSTLFNTQLSTTVEDQDKWTKENFTSYVENYLASEHAAGNNYKQIQRLLKDFYNKPRQYDPPSKAWYIRLTDSQSDGEFHGGQIVEIGEKLALGFKQHAYLWEYVHPSHRALLGIEETNGTYTPHAYEYQYIMDTNIWTVYNHSEDNSVETSFTAKVADAFASFAKTGDPSTAGVSWPAVDDPVKIKYLSVGEQVKSDDDYFTETAKVWKKVYALGYAQAATGDN